MIFPADLRQKVIKTAHKLGHLGITKPNRQQQIKPLVISDGPWWQISLDCLVPYPDGHYNLVTTDQRSRYPEVETVSSTGIKPTKVKLRKTFAHHCTTKQVCTDNGPPFKSKEFSDFAQEEGSKHPRANGQAERFIHSLKKTAQTAHLQQRTGFERNKAIYDMLVEYRDAQHPATGVTPYREMSNKPI
ncbi:Uncharacterized protein P5673_010246 [Acropora cervicornis]|uniref:Integrase catalytic domain-containing protein n=1 Tax=Acropora cervicornis TaxID=6130 RepID=A0AAD9QR17_ACRCE|nr:Uncharacterized protein P5673_010246 [Acropora cervicornis]